MARSQPQAPYPTKFRHLVHQLLEALLLSLHLDEMLQLWVHRAQTRRGRRRGGIHPSTATRAETNSAPTHRPSRVSATEPEPQPAVCGPAPGAHCVGAWPCAWPRPPLPTPTFPTPPAARRSSQPPVRPPPGHDPATAPHVSSEA